MHSEAVAYAYWLMHPPHIWIFLACLLLPWVLRAADSPEWFSVTSDPAAIAKARELAEKVQQLDDAAFWEKVTQHPASLTGQDIARLRADPQWRTQLETLFRDGKPEEKINAALVLCLWQDTAAREYLLEPLTNGPAAARQQILTTAGAMLRPHRDPVGETRAFFAADPAFLEAAFANLMADDPTVADSALAFVRELETPSGYSAILDAYFAGKFSPKAPLYYSLRNAPLSPELLKFTLGNLYDDKGNIRIAADLLLARFAKSDNPDYRQPARAAAKKYLDDTWNPQALSSGIRAPYLQLLAETNTPDDAAWLVQRFKAEKANNAAAIFPTLKQMDPELARKLLLERMQDRQDLAAFLFLIKQEYGDSGDPVLLNGLKQISRTWPFHEWTNLAVAARFIGGQQGAATAQGFELALNDRLRKLIAEQTVRLPPQAEIAAMFEEAGIMDRAAFHAAAEQRLQSPDEQDDATPGQADPIGVLTAAGRVVAFDSEADRTPARHDWLLAEFAANSMGAFQPESAVEMSNKNDYDFIENYDLSFIQDGHLYQSQLQYFGDWFDVRRTVYMVNRALADAGVDERFCGVETRSQLALFVYVKPAQMQALATAFEIPIFNDPAAVAEMGVAYPEAPPPPPQQPIIINVQPTIRVQTGGGKTE